MPLLLIGMNHKTAPVELRERLNELCHLGFPSVNGRELELVSIFTCNRVEFYFHGPEPLVEEAFAAWRTTASLLNRMLIRSTLVQGIAFSCAPEPTGTA